MDLHDGALAPERARIVGLHVEQCARGRVAAGHSLLAQGAGLLPPVAKGHERWIALGATGTVVAMAALAWSAGRNGLPTLGRLR